FLLFSRFRTQPGPVVRTTWCANHPDGVLLTVSRGNREQEEIRFIARHVLGSTITCLQCCILPRLQYPRGRLLSTAQYVTAVQIRALPHDTTTKKEYRGRGVWTTVTAMLPPEGPARGLRFISSTADFCRFDSSRYGLPYS
ncbi:unnamed protein product, partial [Ectocarpus fasciculatus]